MVLVWSRWPYKKGFFVMGFTPINIKEQKISFRYAQQVSCRPEGFPSYNKYNQNTKGKLIHHTVTSISQQLSHLLAYAKDNL